MATSSYLNYIEFFVTDNNGITITVLISHEHHACPMMVRDLDQQ